MLTVVAFIVAIGVLVVVHELGHFTMARICGVRVLRFSVGFGPRLFGWTSPDSGTEFVLSAVPLGGYVKMLDEREGPVSPHDRPFAFDVQSLWRKAAIVVAGPLANLVLAILLYSTVNWVGVEMAQAILAKPAPGTVLAVAGFSGGELVHRAGFEGETFEEVASFDALRWWLARGGLEKRNVQVEFTNPGSRDVHSTLLMMGEIDTRSADAQLFERIGISGPFSQARLGALLPNGAAVEAHLRAGDVVLRVDQTDIVDAGQLRELIRLSGHSGTPRPQTWLVERDGVRIAVLVSPLLERDGGKSIGRVGAIIGSLPAMVTVQYGLVDGVRQAIARTWETSALTVRVMFQIVTGDASLSNLSGPITIADYAGKSAAMGVTQFLIFLALMSVSLGVLNLLPVPVLDGGHLMYYLWEALSGKPVAQSWMDGLQKVGLMILLMMMSVAVVNDVTRLLR